ncbi:MAG: BON domain-containing protein [Holosporaceae bacterium]|jgi:osmotically-inducible protein OsmY|nr:BON domain-containing protein [Holosporaceae bacterium]
MVIAFLAVVEVDYMKTIGSIVLLPLLLSLVACDPVTWIVGGTAVVGTTVVRNREGISGSISDNELHLKIMQRLFSVNKEFVSKVELSIKHGMVVVIGYMEDDKQCEEVMSTVRSVDGYREVFDETSVQEPPGPKDFAIDSSITSRIKSALAFDGNVLSLNYDVTTCKGIVYLCGTASSKFERDVVVNHARSTSGVEKVVVYIRIDKGNEQEKSMPTTKKVQKEATKSTSSTGSPVSPALPHR